MSREDVVISLLLIFLFGTLIGLLLILADGISTYNLTQKIKCRMGKHRYKSIVGKSKTSRYRCDHCGKPRKHLKVVDNGR